MAIIYRDDKNKNWQKIEKGKYKDETHLQNILYNDPDIIPFSDMDSDRKPLRVVIKEMGLPGSGNTDIIGIDEDGRISIIETKLASNPEVKRKVIGQILEYASFLWSQTYEEFDRNVSKILGGNLADIMREKVGDDNWDEESFRSNISETLEKGNFTLFIVVDEMNDELKRILDFLNSRKMSNLEIYALSFGYFKDPQSGQELLLPQIFGYKSPSGQGPKPNVWDETSFFDQAKTNLDERGVEILRDMYSFVKDKGKVSWGRGQTATFCMKLKDSRYYKSLFCVFSNGRTWVTVGDITKFCGKEIAEWLVDKIKTIGFVIPEGKDLEHAFPESKVNKFNDKEIRIFKDTIGALCHKIETSTDPH